jgi:hypothetical protein
VIRMGRMAALAAAIVIMGPFSGLLWGPLPASGQPAARTVESSVPGVPDIPTAPGLAGTVGSQARAGPGEAPPRHVLAGRIDHLIDRVVALNEHYGWTWSHTGSLIAFLEEAFIDLDDGRPADAAHQLRTFRERVSSGLAEGTLAPEAGAPLLAATSDLLTRVEALDVPAGPADGR